MLLHRYCAPLREYCAPLRPEAQAHAGPGPPQGRVDKVQGSAPLGSIFGWLDWGRGHTCSGLGWGGALPGLQLLAQRTDKASAATAGPEAWEPG